jgi:hypothetical protein
MTKLFRCLIALCLPLAGCTGGQTGDLGGGMVYCGEPVAVPEDVAEEFGLSEALALEGESETSLRWRDLSEPQNGTFATEPDTRLRVTFSLGTPGWFGTWMGFGTGMDGGAQGSHPLCRRLVIPLQARVETTDGALKRELKGELYRQDREWWRAVALHQDGHGRETSLSIGLYPDGLRGYLSAPEAQGTFPVDECGPLGTPIELSTQQPWLGMQSVNQLIERFEAALSGDGGVDASWRDGSVTGLTLELATSEAEVICGAPPSLKLPLSGKLRSADGRIDLDLDRVTLVYSSGVARLHAGGSDSSVSMRLPGDTEAAPASTGFVLVPEMAGPGSECLFWPPRPASSEHCLTLIDMER